MRHTMIAVLAVAALTACGNQPLVMGGSPGGVPYAGPMSVPIDHADEAGVLKRSGAAGLALECDGEPYQGGAGDYDSGLESVQDSAEAAVKNLFKEEGLSSTLPDEGYRVERKDGGRVLFSYDVTKRTRIAFIASDSIEDYKHHTGWGVEAWAQCDPAEFPETVTKALGIDIWHDALGARVPVSRVQSFKGAAHCDWQDITFLLYEKVEYVRDPRGTFNDILASAYDDSATLPADAIDTKLEHDGRRLWIGPDLAAYLVNLDDSADVQRWPAAERPIGCD